LEHATLHGELSLALGVAAIEPLCGSHFFVPPEESLHNNLAAAHFKATVQKQCSVIT
jgi:hypothetical protein